MAVIQGVTARGLQRLVGALEHPRIDLQLVSAPATHKMVVSALRQLVCQMPVWLERLPDDPVINQELERAVDGRLGKAGGRFSGPGEYLQRR